MVDHTITLKTWSNPPAPSLDGFTLDELKAVQREDVAHTVQPDGEHGKDVAVTAQTARNDAAEDLEKALKMRSEQASACHEGAPRSTAGVTAALQASEGQPLSPAACWLSAHLPAGCFPCLWQAAQL